MGFFQNSVIKKHLKTQDTEAVKTAYQKFMCYFHNPVIQQNIRAAKEEQFQEGFLRELFVNILGYTLNPHPNFNLTSELKNEKGAQKADGAILQNGKALGVIELKGTDIVDLDKINLQAFNYKNNQSGCIYVITSNFEKLRFFIHNSVDHLEFNLFTLTESDFQLLWICLSADNLLKGIPLKIKEESLVEEVNITKQLYKDYAAFRTDLWQNMLKNNLQADKILLFKKTQKLLDRFLFIFFAEDSGLLPPNSISRIVNRWNVLKQEDAYKPLYEIFKQYFGYIDIGRKGQKEIDDIFAYNGGLFQPDVLLDNIMVDDDVLHLHTIKLSNYDFQSDIDVNILGHIFENSLNEIENITAELQGQEIDKSKSKRKKDGVFYTPKYITKYIVENTVGKLCEEKKIELGVTREYAPLSASSSGKKKEKQILLNKLTEYRNWLRNITICDPACGSGAFLNQALEFLMEEHAYIDELQAQLFGASIVFQDESNHILEKNIFGVDINEESVDIAKLSLWLRTAQRGRKLTTLNNNIKCGNSLIDDPEVAGDKAFNWQKEFPTVFHEKNKIGWHITCATHNSRYSQRMFDNYVRLGEAIWLSEKEEEIVSQTIAEIVEKDKLNIPAYNICGDHMHILLVCEEAELPSIVQKIKSITARACNIAMGRTIPETREHAPVASSTTVSPSTTESPLSTTEAARGETQTHLWTQKYGSKEIISDEQLNNTLEYIRNNRIKHELPDHSPTHTASIAKITCSTQHAFRTEYKGGFDVVIGNPPYVQSHSIVEIEKNFIYRNYRTAEYQINTYGIFVEKFISLLKYNSLYSLIIPNYWLSTKYDKQLRKEVFVNNHALEIVNIYEVFESAIVDTLILTGRKVKSEEHKTHILSISNSCKSIDERLNDLNLGLWSFNEFKEVYYSDEDVSISFNSEFKLKGNKNLKDFFSMYQGMKPYEEGKGTPLQTREMMENKIYHSSVKLDESYLPLLGARHIKRYYLQEFDEYIKYGKNLAAPRNPEIFQGERILINRILSKDTIDGVLVTDHFINNTDVFNLIPFTQNLISIKVLYALILSKLCATYFKKANINLNREAFPKINVNTLETFPVPDITAGDQDMIQSFVDSIQTSNIKLHIKKKKFFDLLRDNLGINKLNQKIESFYESDFKAFLSELAKLKIKLSLSNQVEWKDFFEQYKMEINKLQSEISKTDKEIDQMVYKLYNLTEEEIKIVENT